MLATYAQKIILVFDKKKICCSEEQVKISNISTLTRKCDFGLDDFSTGVHSESLRTPPQGMTVMGYTTCTLKRSENQW